MLTGRNRSQISVTALAIALLSEATPGSPSLMGGPLIEGVLVDTRFWKLVRVGGILSIAVGAFAAPSFAGNVCDLRTNSSCDSTFLGNAGGQALFLTDEQHPTGTGFIDSFVRIQQNGWEQGYNTSARPVESDNTVKTDPNYTRNLTLGEVGTKVINGVTYREFFLDVNEPAGNNKNWITLDQLEVYQSNTASLNDYSGTANTSNGSLAGGGTSTKIYDLDAATDSYVELDYLVKGNGSGSGDMVFYLAGSLFRNKSPNRYVYLFSQFGDLNAVKNDDHYESQAGFEEWFTKSAIPPPNIQSVPEPASLLLLGSGLAFVARRRVRRKA